MPSWIFGYGSLLWRPGLPGDPVPQVARVRGWERRLDQGSPDHRGTPERLGRVATLVSSTEAMCWGAVYAIEARRAGETLRMLDHRERGGYVRVAVRAELRSTGQNVDAVTWIARRDNPYFLGPASLDAMRRQIAQAHGPSGSNREYVLRLAATLRAWDLPDPHVFALERALLADQ